MDIISVLGYDPAMDKFLIPLDRVLPLVLWLEKHYGSLPEVTEATDIPTRTLQKIKQGKHSHVEKPTALRVVEAVQALKHGDRTWSLYENEDTPRYPNYKQKAEGFRKTHEKRFVPPGQKKLSKKEKLTPREERTMRLVGEGLSNKEIAEHFSLTEKTARNYVRVAMMKLNLRSRAEAVAYAQRELSDSGKVEA